MNTPDNVITVHFSDYQYGMMLANHGIGFAELSTDWPEVLESEYAMRGYREAWRKNAALARMTKPKTPDAIGARVQAAFDVELKRTGANADVPW